MVGGIEPRTLAGWWRDLCTQDLSKAPQAFQEIYPHVRSFEGSTFQGRVSHTLVRGKVYPQI